MGPFKSPLGRCGTPRVLQRALAEELANDGVQAKGFAADVRAPSSMAAAVRRRTRRPGLSAAELQHTDASEQEHGRLGVSTTSSWERL